jgi:lipopolysaccharide export LptBFGC system permease protein LptF
LAQAEGGGTDGLLALFLGYYSSFVPQMVFQYMLPAVMLLAASITVTASYCGPRGNNEFTVIRSSGVPILRAFLPLVIPAMVLTTAFELGRDFFLPRMVREYNGIYNRLRSRHGLPTSVSLLSGEYFQTIAIGSFDTDGTARNLILEFRAREAFRRGDPGQGDNDFVAYRAAAARLAEAPDGGYQWLPLSRAEIHTYGRFARRSRPWTDPVPTSMTPAMIERQILGDAVSSWRDLLFLRSDNPGADFELHWRLAEPLACCLLILCGVGLCMGRMLRAATVGYVPAVAISVGVAALFYSLRLAGKSLWEAGMLAPGQGVWLPLAAVGIAALAVSWWMER